MPERSSPRGQGEKILKKTQDQEVSQIRKSGRASGEEAKLTHVMQCENINEGKTGRKSRREKSGGQALVRIERSNLGACGEEGTDKGSDNRKNKRLDTSGLASGQNDKPDEKTKSAPTDIGLGREFCKEKKKGEEDLPRKGGRRIR